MPLSPDSRPPRPAALACTECRRKHLRCDGGLPVCGRCDREKLASCTYVSSRRGIRQPTRRLVDVTHSNGPSTNIFRVVQDRQSSHHDSLGSSTASSVNGQLMNPLSISRPPTISWQKQELISLYYASFHDQHPILVPRDHFEKQDYPEFLVNAVCLIGQLFSACPPATRDYASAADLSRCTSATPVERVQALTLYGVILHMLHQAQIAQAVIEQAMNIAIHMGMSSQDYASSAVGNEIMQESLRATWWELAYVETFLKALHRRSFCSSMIMDHTGKFPSLPWSDATTSSETHHTLAKTSEFNKYLRFSPVYSHHGLRAEAAWILRRVMEFFDEKSRSYGDIRAIDSAIAAWKYHEPDIMIGTINHVGEVDPIAFQGLFTLQCASILLHFPQSDLPFLVPSRTDVASTNQTSVPSPSALQHTLKTIAASHEICDLAAMPREIRKQSPLFICAVILACMVQLAAATAHLRNPSNIYSRHHQDHINLLFGVLRRLEDRWTVANVALRHLRPIADLIFTSRNSTNVAEPSLTSEDSSFPENTTWFDLFVEATDD